MRHPASPGSEARSHSPYCDRLAFLLRGREANPDRVVVKAVAAGRRVYLILEDREQQQRTTFGVVNRKRVDVVRALLAQLRAWRKGCAQQTPEPKAMAAGGER